MKHTLLALLSILLFFVGLTQQVWGQTTLGIQDFETTPATPTMTYTESGSGGTAGILNGSSGTNDRPQSTNWASNGSQA